MQETGGQKGWLREVIEFALDEDVNLEIERQQQLLQDDPHSAKVHFSLAVLYYSQRRVEQAISEFQAAIDCDPSIAPAYRKLGEIYVNTGDYERAGEYALKAAELGDRTLLEMFERYPAVKKFVEKTDGQ